MNRYPVLFTATIFLACFSFRVAAAKTSHPFVDKKIAGLVIGKDAVAKVARLFGKAAGFEDFESHDDAVCYYNANGQTYMKIDTRGGGVIDGISIIKADVEGTHDECKKIKSKEFVTGKKIKLGDTIQKIIEIYGEPQERRTKDNTTIYEYHTDYENDSNVELFYDLYLSFKDGVLVGLSVHDGE